MTLATQCIPSYELMAMNAWWRALGTPSVVYLRHTWLLHGELLSKFHYFFEVLH